MLAPVKAIAIQDIKQEWTWIRPRLERLLGKIKSDGWIIEDVYASLVTSHATLYAGDGGFAVLQVFPHYTGKRLHVWILETVNPERHLEALLTLAKEHGASRITFESPRKGWAKRAERLGFKAARVVYERLL